MSFFGNDEDETNDDYRLDFATGFSVDCTVIMVDAGSTMRSALKDAVRVLADVLARKIRYQRDRIAIIFYNTDNASNTLQFRHIYVYRSLDAVDAESIMRFQDVYRRDEKYGEFCDSLGLSDQVEDSHADFSQVVWTAIMLFGSVKSKSVFRRVFILTNQPDPSNGNATLLAKAQKKMADLCELGAVIEVLPVKTRDTKISNFDMRQFYFQFVDEEDVDDEKSSLEKRKVSDWEPHLATYSSRQRVLARTTLSLDSKGEQAIALQVYSMRMEAKIPSPIYLDPQSNELLTPQTNWMTQDTGELLDDSQLTSYMPYAGQNITLSKEDLKNIKSVYPAGMQLLGFKPRAQLLDYHNLKPALFIRPDDKRIVGSSQIMQVLIQRMAKKDVFMVARMNLRDIQVPRIVALLPQTEKMNDIGDVVVPAGLNCITMPYADDLRQIPEARPSDMTRFELVDCAINICKEFQIEHYTPKAYDNPHIARFYSTLRALALNQPELEPVEDLLTVGEPKQSRALFEEFVQVSELSAVDIQDSSSKRSNKLDSLQHSKKAKINFDPENPDFRLFYENDQLSKLTIAQLKVYLHKHDLPVSGAKAAIINRIIGHMTSE
uniref:SAP domain-containing protein n=1 Tax=Spongospora subterranea TaxID=70186 RepID=A0A0H5QIA3_9EUKA|eukprot:CRZ01352.1 hypothetical protein [Spongospora subterranea]